MTKITTKERAAGAVMGTLIGDALGVGPHWYYDLEKLKQDYGKWIDGYTAPKPGRFHEGLLAGENSQTGQVLGFLLDSVAERGAYDESDFCDRMDSLIKELDGTPHGGRYTDAAMRDVYHARTAGKDWSKTGSFADTAEAAIRTPVLASRYHQDFAALFKKLRSNVRLTHRDPFIAGQSVAFGLIVAALINGETLNTAADSIFQQAKAAGISLSIPLPEGIDAENREVSFPDAVLQSRWSAEAAKDDAVQVNPPQKICRLFGLACTLGFMLPAAYYFCARFENDFEPAVLSAINGGGNNMARASLTGALAGALSGINGIPDRFITGLADHEHLLESAQVVAAAGERRPH